MKSTTVACRPHENASEGKRGLDLTVTVSDATYFHVRHSFLLEQIVNGNLQQNQEDDNTIVSLLKKIAICV